MYPTKEQLEKKWWHRLVKVLIILLTIIPIVAAIDACVFGKDYDSLPVFFSFVLMTYFGLWFIYKKVILYILYGRKDRNKKESLDVLEKVHVEQYSEKEINQIKSADGDLKKEKKDKERELTKSETQSIKLISTIVGFGVAIWIFQLGSFGFLPAFLIAMGCYFIVKKIAETIIDRSNNNVND